MTAATIAERVAAGAAWLDEHQPGWVDRIDLDKLVLNLCSQCVLGQLFGNYWDAPLAGHGASSRFDPDHQAAAEPLGFTGTEHDGGAVGSPSEWDELTAAWRDLIRARRAVR